MQALLLHKRGQRAYLLQARMQPTQELNISFCFSPTTSTNVLLKGAFQSPAVHVFFFFFVKQELEYRQKRLAFSGLLKTMSYTSHCQSDNIVHRNGHYDITPAGAPANVLEFVDFVQHHDCVPIHSIDEVCLSMALLQHEAPCRFHRSILICMLQSPPRYRPGPQPSPN